MTTKEIGQAVGKQDQTVRGWIREVALKNNAIALKNNASTSSNPASYDLAETCIIIEHGMGTDVANVYRTNAANAEMQNKPAKLCGAFLSEINKAYAVNLVSKNEARAMMGLPPVEAEPLAIAGNIGKISKQAYAVEMRVREKEQAKIDARKSPSLFDK